MIDLIQFTYIYIYIFFILIRLMWIFSNKVVASKMEIKAMPTFLLMKEGTIVDKLVGANPEEMRKRINDFAQTKLVESVNIWSLFVVLVLFCEGLNCQQ